jgi:hypothetical protein
MKKAVRELRELSDSELDAVTGGVLVHGTTLDNNGVVGIAGQFTRGFHQFVAGASLVLQQGPNAGTTIEHVHILS